MMPWRSGRARVRPASDGAGRGQSRCRRRSVAVVKVDRWLAFCANVPRLLDHGVVDINFEDRIVRRISLKIARPAY